MKIIGGAPRSGKTTFSKIISNKNSQKIIHLDNLRSDIFKSLSEEEKKEIFFLFYKINNYSNLDKKLFNYFKNNKNIINILKKLGFKTNLEKFIKDFGEEKYFQEEFYINDYITKYFLENLENNLIIEGVSVSPEILKKYEIQKENVLFLVKSDINDILNILEKDAGSFKNRDFKKFSRIILEYGEKIEKIATKNNFKVIDTSKIDISNLEI